MSLREDLINSRYLLDGETEDEMWERVATFVTQKREELVMYKDCIKEMLSKGDIIFNSPILMNAGKSTPLSSACYVLPVEDNIESIMDLQQLSAKIFKLGAGVGADYSRLRPEGFPVGSGGTSSGPCSFMSLVDNLAEVIKSGGKRRAAIMSSLRVDHVDIEKFIKIKENDDKLLNTNISVMITDEFMQGVYAKKEKELRIWNSLIDNAWKRGDPGVIFIDTINRNTNRVSDLLYEGVNACVIGSTKILTDKGHIPISELVGEKVNVWNGEEWSEVTPRVTGENKQVYTVLLSNMEELTCTDYHRFQIADGYKGNEITKTTLELQAGDKLIKFDFPEILTGDDYDYNEMYTNGFFSGDGFYAKNQPCIPVYSEPKLKCAESFLIKRILNQKTRDVFVLKNENIRPKYWVPDCSYSPKARVSWLAGIIDSDGCINNKNKIGGTIAVSSTNLPFLKDIRYMLGTLGCSANITTMHEEGYHFLPDGMGGEKEYSCKTSYRLFLTGTAMNKLIKFGMETKRVPIAFYEDIQSNSKFVSVVSVTKAGVADKVYCFNEPKLHNGVFNGLLTKNCSEFSLYPYESCLIGSINLANLDVNSDECFSELYFVAELVAKCLDNVIDHSWYPDDRVEEAAKKYRRVGVGITGLADCLFNKGLRYGSDEAVEFTKKIMKTIQDGTINASVELAEKYGAFSEYENIIWDTRFLINKPIRNITTTVVAPAGSTSILAGADGSGCEPLFSLAYDRMMRRDKEDWYTVVPDIVQKTFNKYGITLTPEKIMDIKDNGGSVQGLDWVPEELQEYLVTAQDLTPDDHLKMLISVQKFVGASVSKTINLPNSATREDVENIYMTAYENGVKGITIFRDGCKSNQVLRTAKREDPVVLHTKDLPMVMPSVRVKIPTPSGSMYMMTSFYKNKPVEVFCNLGKSGMDDYAYTEALGRVISLCLKRGIPADNIIKTLKGIRGREVSVFNDHYVYSVPDAIAIALGEAVAGYEGLSSETRRDANLSNNLCPDCNVPLTLDNGCFSCYNCGYSSCS